MNTDLDAVVLRFAGACASALRVAGRDQLVAVILHGSLVLDDFVPGRSDIDLLVVVDRPLADTEAAAVQAMGTGWCDEGPFAVDLRVVTRSAASHPSRNPEIELYIGCHGGAIEVQRRGKEPDLLVEFSAARAIGQSITGPEPSSVIGSVPTSWINEYGDRQLARWQRLTDDQRHAELMVLTACRIWQFATIGVHTSKSAAGRWALTRDPGLTAITDALDRRGGGEVTIGPEGIGQVLLAARSALAGHF